jgi:predicted NodU family carbamoyl transferase
MFLGYIYDKIADFAGVNEPGKLMGLASYAKPNVNTKYVLNKILSEIIENTKINEVLESAVKDIIEISSKEKNINKNLKSKFIFSEKITEEGIQAAANTQFIVENFFIDNIGAIVTLIESLDKSFNTLNLTGGFTLNCPTNTSLSKKYKNLYVNPLPACGDSGISIGAGVAAMLVFNHEVERDKNKNLSAAFPPLNINTKFTNEDYEIFGLAKHKYNGRTEVFLAEMLIKKKILCLFRGRSEVGPRALGRRSIIATATSEKIRDKINKAKGRELWRPLAPICRIEDYNDYFEGDGLNSQFMLFTNKVKSSVLKGVTHVDGTARVQSITEQDFWIHNCLSIMKNKKEIPVIINTSFNCAGEPIVESIQDAFKSFSKMNFDYLVTDIGIFTKQSVK